MLDNHYALLFIRGERPVMDEKYDILKHPNIALTEDGGAAPYEHGGTENAVATLSFAGAAAETLSELSEPILKIFHYVFFDYHQIIFELFLSMYFLLYLRDPCFSIIYL